MLFITVIFKYIVGLKWAIEYSINFTNECGLVKITFLLKNPLYETNVFPKNIGFNQIFH